MTHHVRLLATLGLTFALAGLASACSWTENDTRSATAGLPDVRQALESETWVLDAARSSLEPAPSTEVTLEVDGGSLSGAGPCNRYFAGADLDDHTLTVDALGSTQMACEAATMEAEAAYLDALEGQHTVDVTDRDRLVLERDGARLEYVAADTD
jgi:heat shock protein HslJ